MFAAGLALKRAEGRANRDQPSGAGKAEMPADAAAERELATDSRHAGAYMMGAVRGFNEQLERLAELAVVMVTGAMLHYVQLPDRAVWFVLLLLLVARPLSVWLGLMGATGVSRDQRLLISWFGIRGVGSIFYLMYAINHGLPEPLATETRRDHADDGRRVDPAPRHLGDPAHEPLREAEVTDDRSPRIAMTWSGPSRRYGRAAAFRRAKWRRVSRLPC